MDRCICQSLGANCLGNCFAPIALVRRFSFQFQCDLLELRDAHAKLRTSNEKMRREKERHEREREEMKGIIASKRRLEQTEARNVNILLQQVDDLMRLFPELNGAQNYENKQSSYPPPETYTPTPPRRLKVRHYFLLPLPSSNFSHPRVLP